MGKDTWEKRLAALGVPDAMEDGNNNKRDTGVSCVTAGCSETIVEETSQRYFGDPGSLMVGPSSRSQLTQVTDLYCPNCGVSYHHLPKLRKEGGKKF